jgi:hypothetical protein
MEQVAIMANKPRKADPKASHWSTVQVAEITGLPRFKILRWIRSGAVREPMKDPSRKELLWTKADIEALVRYSFEQEQVKYD